MRLLAALALGAVLGVAGTLGVQAATDDAGPSQRAIDAAYERCVRDLGRDPNAPPPEAGVLDLRDNADVPPTASDRATCRREAREVTR